MPSDFSSFLFVAVQIASAIVSAFVGIRLLMSTAKDAKRENLKLDLEILHLARELELHTTHVESHAAKSLEKMFRPDYEIQRSRESTGMFFVLLTCIGALTLSVSNIYDGKHLYAAIFALMAVGSGAVFVSYLRKMFLFD